MISVRLKGDLEVPLRRIKSISLAICSALYLTPRHAFSYQALDFLSSFQPCSTNTIPLYALEVTISLSLLIGMSNMESFQFNIGFDTSSPRMNISADWPSLESRFPGVDVNILPYRELFFLALSDAVLYANTHVSIIRVLNGIHSNSSQNCIEDVKPRPRPSALASVLAVGRSVIVFLVIGFFIEVTFSVPLFIFIVSKSILIFICKNKGIKSLWALSLARFILFRVESLLPNVIDADIEPKWYA